MEVLYNYFLTYIIIFTKKKKQDWKYIPIIFKYNFLLANDCWKPKRKKDQKIPFRSHPSLTLFLGKPKNANANAKSISDSHKKNKIIKIFYYFRSIPLKSLSPPPLNPSSPSPRRLRGIFLGFFRSYLFPSAILPQRRRSPSHASRASTRSE
jgi:hypothetical protein